MHIYFFFILKNVERNVLNTGRNK